MPKLRPPMAAAVALALPLVGGCGQGGRSGEDYWRRQKAVADPLELWSIEAVGQGAGPAAVCMDQAMRLGLVKPVPAVGGGACTLTGDPVEADGRLAFKCRMAGREWAVTSLWRGDRGRDFTDTVLISPLDPPFATYRQVRHYHRLGACPPGWAAGDGAGPDGRRAQALMPWPSEASPGPHRGWWTPSGTAAGP